MDVFWKWNNEFFIQFHMFLAILIAFANKNLTLSFSPAAFRRDMTAQRWSWRLVLSFVSNRPFIIKVERPKS
jgi:hypothetical protein